MECCAVVGVRAAQGSEACDRILMAQDGHLTDRGEEAVERFGGLVLYASREGAGLGSGLGLGHFGHVTSRSAINVGQYYRNVKKLPGHKLNIYTNFENCLDLSR
jgi:hypothetical protein